MGEKGGRTREEFFERVEKVSDTLVGEEEIHCSFWLKWGEDGGVFEGEGWLGPDLEKPRMWDLVTSFTLEC